MGDKYHKKPLNSINWQKSYVKIMFPLDHINELVKSWDIKCNYLKISLEKVYDMIFFF